MAKLTLAVDERVIARAKTYAKRRGTSVSKIVETYLSAVADPSMPAGDQTPVLRSLRGILKGGGIQDYRKHLAAKYR